MERKSRTVWDKRIFFRGKGGHMAVSVLFVGVWRNQHEGQVSLNSVIQQFGRGGCGSHIRKMVTTWSVNFGQNRSRTWFLLRNNQKPVESEDYSGCRVMRKSDYIISELFGWENILNNQCLPMCEESLWSRNHLNFNETDRFPWTCGCCHCYGSPHSSRLEPPLQAGPSSGQTPFSARPLLWAGPPPLTWPRVTLSVMASRDGEGTWSL